MGWASGGEIFDDVARALIDVGVTDEVKRVTLGKLIDKLRDGDWDTEDESLREFHDDPVIVELFAKRGITATCGAGEGTPGKAPCVRGLGHKGDHVDKNDDSWTQATQGVPA